MANDGIKIYIDPNTTGVEIADIQTVIGSSRNDLGGLITEGDINPFALYKPVREPALGMITRGDFGSLGLGSSSSVNALPYATTINGFVALYTDGDTNNLWKTNRANGWRYHKPRGKSQNEMSRIFDFVKVVSENGELHPVNLIGYNHRAVNPFGKFGCVETVSKNGGLFTASNTRTVPQTGVPEYDITIEDINATINSAYKMLYYGVMLFPQENQSGVTTTYLIFNNNQTINDGNTGDDYIRGNEWLYLNQFALSDTMPVGLYTAYPFLTPSPLDANIRYLVYLENQRTTQLPARLYPLPGTTPLTVNIYNTELIINVIPVGDVGATFYDGAMYLTIRNNGAETAYMPYLELQFRTEYSSYRDDRRPGEVFYKIYEGVVYRIDDTHRDGVRDNRYDGWLTPETPYQIPGNGGEIRIPAGELATLFLSFPSPQTRFVIVGDPTRSTVLMNVYGIAEFRMPATPDANLLIDEQP